MAKSPGPTALLPEELDQQRQVAMKNAIMLAEGLTSSKLPVEQRLVEQIRHIDKGCGLFRMWTHPEDWGAAGEKIGFKRRCRLGDMLYGAYNGGGSNCDNGYGFDGAPLDLIDLAAWQHDMDYGKAGFLSRLSDGEFGNRAWWADSRLCECMRRARPWVGNTPTGKFLDLMGRIFTADEKFRSFQQVPLNSPNVHRTVLNADVGESFYIADVWYYGLTSDAEQTGKSPLAPRDLWDRVKKKMFEKEKYGELITVPPTMFSKAAIEAFMTRPAWMMNFPPKDFTLPMVDKAKARYKRELEKLIPAKYGAIVDTVYNTWSEKYYTPGIHFGRKVLGPR